jgi:hypothetical protein
MLYNFIQSRKLESFNLFLQLKLDLLQPSLYFPKKIEIYCKLSTIVFVIHILFPYFFCIDAFKSCYTFIKPYLSSHFFLGF